MRFKTASFLGVLLLIATLGFSNLNTTSAAGLCVFTRDLYVGSVGADVQCLQRYLNESGYRIATSGPGSYGYESLNYGELTRRAVLAWQMANGLPASGIFDASSRAKYVQMPSVVVPNPLTNGPSYDVNSLLAQIASLQAEIQRLRIKGGATGDQMTAQDAIEDAIDQINEAEDQIEKGTVNMTAAKAELEKARDDFDDSVLAYMDKDFDEAKDAAEDSYDNAVDAFELAGGKTDKNDADDLIDDVEEKIRETWDLLEQAEDDGEDINESEDILKDAEDKLDDAMDAYDDKDYDKALRLAEDADDLVDDAIEAIGEDGSTDREDAKDAIEDAKDAIDEAEREIDDAEDDGKNVKDAEDFLEEANELLDDAEDKYDDQNYDRAEDLARDAEEAANDAIDELD